MRSQAPQRRELTITLVASLALAAALLLLLATYPKPGAYETGRQDFAQTGEHLPGNNTPLPHGQGGQRSMVNRGQDLFQRAVLDTMGPLLRLFQAPVDAYHNVYEHLQGWQHFEQENRKLKLELARLRILSVRNDDLSLENQRLRLILNMRADPAYHELVARVIGTSSSAFAHSFLLSAGRNDGVGHNATAMAPGGLLGRVVQVAHSTTLVLTLRDLNSRVPVLVQRSRVRAIVSGRNTPLLGMKFTSKSADVRVGDLLVTSGVGNIFPKGLLVGRVHALAATGETGLFRTIDVQPAVDFDRTEEVRLLIPQEQDADRRYTRNGAGTPPLEGAPTEADTP